MNRRERQWRNVRIWEWALNITAIFGLIIVINNHAPAAIFWTAITLTGIAGCLLIWRQYQVLDEYGKLRWLKSYFAMSGIYALGLSGILLWSMWANVNTGSMSNIPFWPLYILLIAGAIASWATWHYLGWRDSRE